MQSPRLSGLPTTHPSFSKHRYSEEDLAFPLKLSLPVPAGLPSWASLPTPPMSGTPPPDPPSDLSQLAGRRRKREDTPPSTSQESASATTNVNISPFTVQTLQRHEDPSGAGRATESALMPPPLTLPWEQPPNYGPASASIYPQSAAPPPPSILNGNQQISPKATRKTKAHVASACVNCKRKHLRCDESRPCRRCTQSGKEDTCRDVEHKKRGRPPLKQDGLDSSTSRLVSGAISLPPLAASSSRGVHGSGLVPLLPTPTPVRSIYPTPYAPPSIAPSAATAHGQFARPTPYPPNRSHVPHLPHGGPAVPAQYGYMPSSRPNPMETEHHQYPSPLFPRQPVMQQLPPNSNPNPYELSASPTTGPYGPNFLQLPPIRPAAPSMTTDPAMAQQQQQQQHPRHLHQQRAMYGQPAYSVNSMSQTAHGDSEERDPKRPRMDIERVLGPR